MTVAVAGRSEAPSGHGRSLRKGRNRGGGKAESRAAKIAKSTLPPLMVVLFILVLWQIGSETGTLPSYVFPAPTAVASELWRQPGLFWENTRVTLLEVGIGSVTGILFGFFCGVLLAESRFVRSAFYPLVIASQSLPMLALAPLLVLWLGFGILPKVIIVVQIVFFPVAVASVQGLATVDPEMLVFGRSLGASRWQLFWKVRFPCMLPYLFGGLKIALSYAAIATVIAEYIGANLGLGALMQRANNAYQPDVLVGAVTLVTLIGLLLFVMVVVAERLVIPWHRRAPTKRKA